MSVRTWMQGRRAMRRRLRRRARSGCARPRPRRGGWPSAETMHRTLGRSPPRRSRRSAMLRRAAQLETLCMRCSCSGLDRSPRWRSFSAERTSLELIAISSIWPSASRAGPRRWKQAVRGRARSGRGADEDRRQQPARARPQRRRGRGEQGAGVGPEVGAEERRSRHRRPWRPAACPSRSAATAPEAVVEKATRHHEPIDIGERGLKIRSMFEEARRAAEVGDQQRRRRDHGARARACGRAPRPRGRPPSRRRRPRARTPKRDRRRRSRPGPPTSRRRR